MPGLIALALVACSSRGDSLVTPKNHPPTIKFAFAKLAVPRASTPNLTVSADDPDGDDLTITWTITRGSLTPQSPDNTVMRWNAPVTVGVDTVVVRVTDGTFARSITDVVKVGWATSGQSALARYEKSKSPYIVSLPPTDPVLTVGALTATVMEPGVEIYFETAGATLRVLGRLEAHGTADLPIVFRPNDRTFVCGDERGWWDGILGATDDAFASDGDIDFEHVEVWYAQAGVRLLEGSHAIVRNCEFRCSGDAGLSIGGTGSLIVLDSGINNGRADGIAISAIASLPDSVHVHGCTIGINGNAGIRLDLADASQTVPILIEYNTIEFNEVHGVSLANAVFPAIHYNHFIGNGESTVSNIYMENGYPDGAPVDTLDATCNFWGAPVASQSTIDATIRDSLDSSSVGTRVKSCPWLNESPITSTPVCNVSCP
jgi:hypothetical protein